MSVRHRGSSRARLATPSLGLCMACSIVVSCTQSIVVNGAYRTSVAVTPAPPAQHSTGQAHLVGVMDWDLQKYMWSTLNSFTPSGTVIKSIVVSDSAHLLSFQAKSEYDNLNRVVHELVRLSIYVQNTQGDLVLLAEAETPDLAVEDLLGGMPDVWEWEQRGVDVLNQALAARRPTVRLICDIEFRDVSPAELQGVRGAMIDLNLPWRLVADPAQ